MRLPPPSVYLNWPKPNYVDPPTRGPEFFVFYGIFLFFATVAVAIRLYTRVAIRRWFGIDDAFIVLSYVLNLGLVITAFNGYAHLDWDKHVWDIRFSNFEPGAKCLFAYKIIWATASASVRLSLLSFFHRLLGHIELRRYNWILLFNVFFVVAIWMCMVLTTVFDSDPIQAYWAFPPLPSKQLNEGLSFTILSGLNTVSELFVASLPIPLLFGSRRLPLSHRWSVVGLLSLGYLVAVVGTARTYFAWEIFTSYDQSWAGAPYLITSEVELDTALICACAPALRPFFGRLLGTADTGSPVERRPSAGKSGRTISTRNKAGSVFSSEKNRSQISELSTNPYAERFFDIEGINTAGFGYKVVITGGAQAESGVRLQPSSRRSRRRNGDRPADSQSATASKWYPFSRHRRRRRGEPQPDNIEIMSLRVHTTQSVEVRKDYRDGARPQSRGFGDHNAYAHDEDAPSRVSSELPTDERTFDEETIKARPR